MSFHDFEKISKALRSTYELLLQEEPSSKIAIENLKEAETSLNQAIDYSISHYNRE